MAAPAQTQASRQAFATLQPLCSGLLELPLRRGSDTSLLISLRQALRECPPDGLRVCLEYVLFPLQLLLDASVECRSRQKPVVSSDAGSSQKINVADRIAEGVLSCIEELLLCCPLTEVSQIHPLLRKLTAAAMLSPDEASEEFRLGAVKCLKGLLSGLRPCGRSFCSCKLTSLPRGIICGNGLGRDISPKKKEEELELELEDGDDNCMIEYLQREDMATTVGHLLSLLLQVSEVEASKGRTGSANLRIEAISTLRILLHKVGTADALAFFLPGMASRLVKSLQSSKRMNTGLSDLSIPSGAAGSSAAAEQSVRALAALLVLVLADERNEAATLERTSHVSLMGATNGNISSAEAALATIRQVSKLNASKKVKQEGVLMNSEDALLIEQDATPANNERQATFRVDRNRIWLDYTSKRIGTLLALCFPALCRHPAPSVRLALAEGAVMLISACQLTLEGFMPTLLESLLGMACDDWPYVASSAHGFLMLLTQKSGGDAGNVKIILKQIVCRLFERIPKVLFSGEKSAALFLCRQLLAAMFFAGPGAVSEIIFQSPASITQFVTVTVHCFGFSSSFVNPARSLSLIQKGSSGYIPGIFELSTEKQHAIAANSTDMPPQATSSEDSKSPPRVVTRGQEFQKLPKMPPWFRESVEWKHYCELASIIRLAGLSSMFEYDHARNLYQLIEELLAPLRHAPSIPQQELFSEDGVIGDGQWQRRVATAMAVLNEAFYGASGLWIHDSGLLFRDAYHHTPKCSWNSECRDELDDQPSGWDPWEKLAKSISYKALLEPIGGILQEFMVDVIWKLPLNTQLDMQYSPSHVHVLRDNLFLQQVTLEGMGTLALSVGKLFEEQGYLGSVLYLLLERLGCPDYHISSTADLTLHVVSTACGYRSVRDLILASTDYIVDSLCRQLRHIDLFPSAPNMLVAVLRYTGAGQDLVSLLQEPLRSISLELEIPARQCHPGNTLSMLRALVEIVKAARGESSQLLDKALVSGGKVSDHMHERSDGDVINGLDNILSEWKENQRHCQSIQEIVTLSLDSCSPLMASRDQHKCLLALEVVEVGIATLAGLEAVAKRQKEERARLRKLAGDDDDDDGVTDSEPPKLLPTMNRVWPHLATCLKHSMPSVLARCAEVIARVVSCCGGDFFARRIQKDVMPTVLSLLSQGSGSQAKSEAESRKLLPHLQRSIVKAGKELASASLVRIQEAMLNCVSEIGKNKRSASALASSLEQLAAMVVGVACGVPALHECATQTLVALSNVDADLMWVLVADVAYGSSGNSLQSQKTSCSGLAFPDVSKLLPPYVGSHDEALWRQLSRKNPSFDIDGSKAWTILSKLEMFV